MNPVHIFLRLLFMLISGLAFTVFAVSMQGPTQLNVHYPSSESR